MRKFVAALLLTFVLFQSGGMMAQDLLKGSDLSTINVDYMSDSDIAKIKSWIDAGAPNN